ncbi:MAG: prepilin-type N-terminal cleavage/methylation domain-containing protein [Opitutales bacterium]
MQSPRASKPKLGFTLVELMVALFIFAVVITGGFACVRMGLTQVDNARHETRASQIMQSEIERLRSMAWASLKALTGSEQTLTVSGEFADAGYDAYVLKRRISGNGDSRKIRLTIAWTDIAGRDHHKTYVTQYTRNGLYDYVY